MKSTTFIRLLLGLFYLLVPLGFLQLSFHRSFKAEQGRLTQETRRKLEHDMEMIRRERNPEVLMTYDASRVIQEFREGIASASAREPQGIDDRRLAGMFHQLTFTPAFKALLAASGEITLCRISTLPTAPEAGTHLRSKLIYRCGKKLGLSPMAARLSLLFDTPIALLARSVDLRARLRSILSIPTLMLELFLTGNERFRSSQNGDRTRGFLWAKIALPGHSDRLLLQIVVDMTGLDETFSSRHLSRSLPTEGLGIAFLPRKPGLRRISTPQWEDASPWSRLPGNPFNGHQPPALVQDGQTMVRNERFAPDDLYDVSLLRRIPLPRGGTISALRLALLGLLTCMGLWFLVETLVFGRGPEPTFSLRMGGVFLLASLLPLAGTQLLGFETFRQGRQTGEFAVRRELRQRLEQLDSGFREFATRTLQSIGMHLSRPGFKKRLRHAEAEYQRTGSLASATEITRRLRQDFQSPRRFSSASISLTFIDTLSLMLIGPDKFFSVCHQYQGGNYTQMQAFYGALGTLWLNIHNPQVERDSSSPAQKNKLSQGVIEEYAIELMLSFFGAQSFLDFLFQSDRLFIMNSGIYQTYVALFGVKQDGVVRYLFLALLGSERLENPYLNALLERVRAPDDPLLFCVDLSTKSSIPGTIASWPALAEVRTRIADTRLPYSGRDASETLLIEGVPGRQITRAAFIGAIPAAPIDREMNRRRWLFGAGVLFSLLLAILMAAGASIIFIRPIRVLTSAVERISHGDYRGGIDLQGGPAEFAALGQAFNNMCEDLRTGKVLGRFVSEGVRRAARDGNLDLLAGEARESRITVLFCGIAQFKTLRRQQRAGALVEILDNHLSRVSTLASSLGGEIDKMVGDKVMVVFDHSRFSSPQTAVEAALTLARHLSRKDGRNRLPLAIGINSGSALSGILGSPAFRLDYTVIGDTVNLAARLSELAHHQAHGGIYLSGQTLELAPATARATRLAIDSVRGKTREVEAYALENEPRGTIPSP